MTRRMLLGIKRRAEALYYYESAERSNSLVAR
jgi:hypothetical protein